MASYEFILLGKVLGKGFYYLIQDLEWLVMSLFDWNIVLGLSLKNLFEDVCQLILSLYDLINYLEWGLIYLF